MNDQLNRRGLGRVNVQLNTWRGLGMIHKHQNRRGLGQKGIRKDE